ncbi:homeodomain-interacting protein kinase 4-like [Chiloscyllium plagiosum]|uniref:homeodomain-interacting protein kinase 4-like n=1 Tax=Chiloscyllium plagiosum TaxID=36176 RepID=UPI001CB7FE48|nr:homeodomain-interacting protein kinase 4-like [Chiloscyllium plagiosum]
MSVMYSDTDVYDVITVLGKGTFGEVAKCWKRGSSHFVAIKIIKNYTFRKGVIKCELKMLRMLGTVNSDKFHIVRFFESFNDDTKLCLVFELLEQSLYEYQRENNFVPLPTKHIRSITKQVLIALQKLKELSIVHTDIKPENIMLVEQAQFPFKVKVIDFGSACVLSEIQQIKEPYIQSRFYRSPEILLGLPFCEKLDMWSLGCVIAELHLGWPIYPGTNEYDQIRYIVETQGLPSDHLLEVARKTHHFFKKARQLNSTYQWTLKTVDEYQAETMLQPLETRTRSIHSLDQLATINQSKTVFPDKELKAELFDQMAMVSLIKKILTYDPGQRPAPNVALKHPFITMKKLKSKYKHTMYYQASRQALCAALRYDECPNEKEALCCHRLKQSCHFSSESYPQVHRHQKPQVANQQVDTDDLDGTTADDFEKQEAQDMKSFPEEKKNLSSDVRKISHCRSRQNAIKLLGRMWSRPRKSAPTEQPKESVSSVPIQRGRSLKHHHGESGLLLSKEWSTLSVGSWSPLLCNSENAASLGVSEKEQLNCNSSKAQEGNRNTTIGTENHSAGGIEIADKAKCEIQTLKDFNRQDSVGKHFLKRKDLKLAGLHPGERITER